MRAPISQKLKKAFSFGSRKDSDIVKEPEFVKVDDYYLVSSRLDGESPMRMWQKSLLSGLFSFL
jgi:hypothetical protein